MAKTTVTVKTGNEMTVLTADDIEAVVNALRIAGAHAHESARDEGALPGAQTALRTRAERIDMLRELFAGRR